MRVGFRGRSRTRRLLGGDFGGAELLFRRRRGLFLTISPRLIVYLGGAGILLTSLIRTRSGIGIVSTAPWMICKRISTGMCAMLAGRQRNVLNFGR